MSLFSGSPVPLFVITILAALSHTSSCILESNAYVEVECVDGDRCDECYIELVKSMMRNDQNLYNLSRTFFLPIEESPVFVLVQYQFASNDSTSADPKIWFWTAETKYLLHPLKGFQYFSLFFGNFQSGVGSVYLTLPLDCYNASDEFYQLLTQRVRNQITCTYKIASAHCVRQQNHCYICLVHF